MDKKQNKKKNPVNKNDNRCFQYATTLALNHKEIGKDSGRITKIKPFIDKYDWEGIDYPSEKDNTKNIEKNDLTITPNVLYAKSEKIYPAYASKHNPGREKQNILLIIPNGKGWHYTAVK